MTKSAADRAQSEEGTVQALREFLRSSRFRAGLRRAGRLIRDTGWTKMPPLRQLGWYREAELCPYVGAGLSFFMHNLKLKEKLKNYGTQKVWRKRAAGDVPQLF